MSGRLRQSRSRAAPAAPEEPEPEVETGPYNVPQLEFNEPLTWRAGRAIPVADLYPRLQKLSKELRIIEQGAIEVSDITKLAQDLVNPNLLGHKDKGVRAWTVCCVVDILNICAPNAPYKNDQLRDIFTVIINSVLPALADPSNAYNAQHQYILQQLVEAESIVLITDLQDAEPLLSSLFTICFDIVSGSGKNASGAEIAKTVEYPISSLLTLVVDEAILHSDVIDIIISQFLRVDPRSVQQPANKKKSAEAKDKSQSTLLLKAYPPAYNVAKVICTACSAKMSGAISQYYGNIVNNASTALSTEDGKGKSFKRPLSPGSDSGDDDAQALGDLQKVHRLMKELWRACPDVLASVIPQCEIELASDSMSLRELAVETLGELIAGIGLAGLPDLPSLDPAAYPLPTIEVSDNRPLSTNPLLSPLSPKPFMHVHTGAYQAFLGRRIDKAPSVRVAWAKAVSKILLTDAGGIGMNEEERKTLVEGLATMLRDIDEKVRLVALQTLKNFPYHAVIKVLGSDGGLSNPGTLLSVVAERVVDKKLPVREQAMLLLGNMWGVASRDISDGNETVRSILGQAPTHILSAMYVKDSHVTTLLLRVLYECLLPLTYPPIKSKAPATSSQGNGANPVEDPDSIRVRRLLTLVRDLDDKSKPIFFGLQKRQADMAKAIESFLKCCVDYNGGVSEDYTEEKQLEEKLNRIVDLLARQQPEPSKFSSDLHKFAKAHDRRNYQLIRFTMGPEHDFRTMTKAMKEFNKRIREGTSTSEAMLDSLNPLLYQCALVCYNRSHLPAIIEYSRSQDAGFADTAQELLREISEKVPEVMKSHIKVLCTELEAAAPTATQPESLSAVDSLKACAAFAKRFPEEVPKDRKFEVALMHFIEYSTSPKASKHATTILLKISTKKELRAKEVITKAVKNTLSGARSKLAQLAAISQVCLLAPEAALAEEDRILKIVTETLHSNPTIEEPEEESLTAWSDDVDEDTTAKVLVLQILVSRCRSGKEKERESFDLLAKSVLDVLMKIVGNNGETTPTKNTPNIQKNHLRLAAARGVVKLCHHKPRCEELVTPQMFETICQIMINPPYAVRRGVLAQIKKYLNTNSLAARWYTIFFLTAFEVDTEIRASTFAWLKSRATFYVRLQQGRNDKKQATNTMELTFARLLSLLTHHPDYPIKDTETYEGELLDFAKYIIYYLQTVATDDNLSLIFHIAQRVKQAQDALSGDSEVQERLYVLSDLAQATIRNYADLMPAHARGMNLLQTWPGKAHLPNALFSPINGHAKAQEIAAKNYLPEDVALGLESLVRQTVRNTKAREPKSKHRTPAGERKRKMSISIDPDDDDAEKSTKKKKARSSASLPIRKTPVAKKRKSEALSVEQPSRKSARTSNVKSVNYVESDEEDEEEDDAENIVKYNPASMVTKSGKKTRTKTPELDEEEEQDQAEDDEEGAVSPTPHAKQAEQEDEEEQAAAETGAESEEADEEMEEAVAEETEVAQDTEMTDRDEEEEEDAGENEEAATEEVDDEAENSEADAEEAEEVEISPKPNGNTRTTRNRGKNTPATKTQTKARAKATVKTKTLAKPTPKSAKDTKSNGKGKGKGATPAKPKTAAAKKAVAPASSPPPAAPEPSRRSSRRVKG